MTFDSNGERAEFPGADDGSRRDDAARFEGEPAVDDAATNGPSADGAATCGPSVGDVVIAVNDEELFLGEVDIERARIALAELGAQGSRSLERLSAQESITLLRRLQRLASAVAAVQARALVHLERAVKQESRERGETAQQALMIARAETGEALRISKSAAGQTMSSSRRLVQSMPGMLTALAQGRTAPASAHQVGKTMGPASSEQRARVDEILTSHLGDLEGCGPGQWGDEAERVLHGLDPAGAAARHEKAKGERNVTVHRGRHGMATVTAKVTALDAARIRKGLSLAAEKARAGGDRRGHQQIMADQFIDALIGRGEGIDPSTLEIGVLVTDRSLLAPNHADAATIEGYGSVPYEHVRQEMLMTLEAAEAGEDPDLALTLRKVFLDQEDGQVVALESRSRQFPPALAKLIRYAHQTCRAPHCDAPIRQIDHIIPWSQGGKTHYANGNGLCAADNQKEHAGQRARVITDEHGIRRSVEWTTRYGQTSRRGGVNFDPVGTARRRQQELARQHKAGVDETRRAAARYLTERRQAEADRQVADAHTAESQVAQTESPTETESLTGTERAAPTPPDAEQTVGTVIDEIGTIFESQFAQLDPTHLDPFGEFTDQPWSEPLEHELRTGPRERWHFVERVFFLDLRASHPGSRGRSSTPRSS
ncbi:HNH endonuclease signature motif containing protein [Brachybacterium sp.]|uniref:HNH endonuclease signature motif containing protein n=1 Tax=Brachybacterium sp. TaxID=1891286 RepID=UPI002ED2BAEE